MYFIYFGDRAREIRRETQAYRARALMCLLTLQYPQWLETRTLCRWLWPSLLVIICCCPGHTFPRNLQSKWGTELELGPKHSNMAYGSPNLCLNYLPHQEFFKVLLWMYGCSSRDSVPNNVFCLAQLSFLPYMLPRFVYLFWESRLQRNREGQRKRELPATVHSPDGCSGQCWARHLGLLPLVFPDH